MKQVLPGRKLMVRSLLPILLLVLLCACSDPAKEKFETAQFEEQQFNKPHAVELYREIINDYPDSSYAPKARQRLKELTAEP